MNERETLKILPIALALSYALIQVKCWWLIILLLAIRNFIFRRTFIVSKIILNPG
jgi:hypothetical protein